ncbi:DegT/DnrJ/EryC1/StrS family aminotransferase [uncultured Cohaesibacter sp.]|uniref:DegT/DnrJ/EryC1/StrS family aminotransferase n=1 Tax=uncultured Cohaesibacter sp. TaxID=1002546 RepID=UPI00292DBCCB|nr:DegT/DnrJ/EryC1/StrS family aminotransferase [uncultured Cohaesibacter sp.]
MQFIDLGAQQDHIKSLLDERMARVLSHGNYIMGPEIGELETALSDFCGAKHSLTCANGTDALQLALMAAEIGAGDAVFVPSFTFASTAEIVPMVGATPFFVDVCADSFNMDADSLARSVDAARKMGLRPAAVIPVDLFGLSADYDRLGDIARAEGMIVIADSAQGFGASYKGRVSGSIGDISTTSFFPAKPLGCYGDGGALFTDNDDWADMIRSLRVHGKGHHKYENVRLGLNSRLDTLQAAILLAKLSVYPQEIEKRQAVAERYDAALRDVIEVPVVAEGYRSVWAQYTLKARDADHRTAIMDTLSRNDIPSAIYYPKPLHMQKAYMNYPGDPDGLAISATLADQVFSIPMHPYLDEMTQDQIIAGLRKAI